MHGSRCHTPAPRMRRRLIIAHRNRHDSILTPFVCFLRRTRSFRLLNLQQLVHRALVHFARAKQPQLHGRAAVMQQLLMQRMRNEHATLQRQAQVTHQRLGKLFRGQCGA